MTVSRNINGGWLLRLGRLRVDVVRLQTYWMVGVNVGQLLHGPAAPLIPMVRVDVGRWYLLFGIARVA